MEIIDRLESQVRGYCRSWPTVFQKSKGAHMWDVDGKQYVDFFAGAGVLNYGHNDDGLQQKLIEYIQSDGVLHGLDMATEAKETFLATFEDVILKPRGMEYKVQFPGPTGTNAVEAALKLARKVTGRNLVVGFTNAFHGMTLGSLSVTGNEMKRRGAGVPLQYSVSMPYEGFFEDEVDTIEYLHAYMQANGSGVESPAAIIVETVQAEGGLGTASNEWLRSLQDLCHEFGALLIVDDIQAGCGRTGGFFSFEEAGIEPDIICMSKSLSGLGLPLAIDLIKPEHDVWDPGEHNGTFRGFNGAFVTATETLNRFWRDDTFEKDVRRKAEVIRKELDAITAEFPEAKFEHRGRGLLQGLYSPVPGLAEAVTAEGFERGLIIEQSGPEAEVMKLLPPLIIDDKTLAEGLGIIRDSLRVVLPGCIEKAKQEQEAAEREAVAV